MPGRSKSTRAQSAHKSSKRSARTQNAQAKPTRAQYARAKYALEKSAGAIVFQRGSPRTDTRAKDAPEYLLIYSSYWEFPKGGIDTQESESEAALREVREETGLNVQLVSDFREEINYFYRRRERGTLVKKQVVYFLGETAEHRVQLSWEHRDSAWLSFEDALARLTFESSRVVLRKAHQFLLSHNR